MKTVRIVALTLLLTSSLATTTLASGPGNPPPCPGPDCMLTPSSGLTVR